MKVVILKYNAGNAQSVSLALSRIGCNSIITDDRDLLSSADRVIFPGQGEASSALRYLRERELDTVLLKLECPVLGICLGHQLLCNDLEEGNSKGFALIPARSIKFKKERKVPHIGWTKVSHTGEGIFRDIPNERYFYFIHSYYVPRGSYETGWAQYGEDFCAATKINNFFGVQFHPEKSGEAGMKLLRNFLSKEVFS